MFGRRWAGPPPPDPVDELVVGDGLADPADQHAEDGPLLGPAKHCLPVAEHIEGAENQELHPISRSAMP